MHIWSEEGHISDALSRLGSEQHAVPLGLNKVPFTKVSAGSFKILGQTDPRPARTAGGGAQILE